MAASYIARVVNQALTDKATLHHRLEGLGGDALALHYETPLFRTFFAVGNLVQLLRDWYSELGFVPCHYRLTLPQIIAEMKLIYEWYGERRFPNQTQFADLVELNAKARERLTTRFGADVRWAAAQQANPAAAAAVPLLHERVAERPCVARSDGGKDRSFPLAARLAMLQSDAA